MDRGNEGWRLNLENQMDVKSMIEPMCREWARQYRRLAQGGVVYPDKAFAPDGWPMSTLLGKMREEGAGAAQGRISQHFAEVYSGDGLLIWRAMERMPLLERVVVHGRFLGCEPVKEQAAQIGISPAGYWATLDRAFFFLAGRVDAANSEPCAELEFSGNRV
jgi:hypothetical protein